VSTKSTSPAKKILVVDDNPVVLKTLTSALEPKGYKVFTALDGSEAFSIVRREKPDLLLLDIFFPPDVVESGNTWDAFHIMRWLQRLDETKDTPVIIISVAEPEKYRDRCLAAGARAFLHKPVDSHELLETIGKIFNPNPAAKTPEPAINSELRSYPPENPKWAWGANLVRVAGRLFRFRH
jgi:CheY-like chemotaxis protein